MDCPNCKTGSLVVTPAEVRLYRNGPRTLSHPPISPSPDIHICSECGWAQFTVPESWLSAGWLDSRHRNKLTSLSEAKPSGVFAA